MPANEGLASLKIDRTRARSRQMIWKVLGIGAAVVLVAFAALSAPKWAESFLGVEVSVARVSFLEAGKGELSAAGYVVADRMSVLAFKGTGRLLKLNVVESQNVRQDEVIAEIDHHEMDAAIRQYEADQKEAEADVKRLEAVAAQAQASVAQAEAGVVQAEAGAANARAEVAMSKSPLETLEFQMREIKVKLDDATRRYERDSKLSKEDAVSRTIVDDELTEIRLAEAQIATTTKRQREIQYKIAVAETQAAMVDSQVTTAKVQVATAKSAVATAKAAVDVAERHVKSMAARIDVLKAQLEDSMIFSPFDGVVIEKAAEVGEIVAPISIGGSMARGSIATIAERKSLQAEVDVAEQYIGKVKVGQRASISIEAFSGKALAGRVLRILPRANRGKATVQVRVAIDNILDHPDIRPDMNLRVKFLPDDAPAGAETNIEKKLAIPKAALQGSEGARFIWIVKDGVAEKSAVVIGDEKGETVEIKSGVKEGQSVAVKGAENIKTDKQKVKVAEEK